MFLIGADPLARFLNGAAATPFAWGRFDCLLFLADWIVASGGEDAAADLRGRYATITGAARIVRDAGGMAALVGRSVAPLGIVRAAKPQRGDIAIVPVAGPGTEIFEGLAGAILLDGTAALLCQDGLLFNRLADAPPVAAWRL